MSENSVTLTFGKPAEPPAPVAPPPPAKPEPNPAVMTREERASANWQVKFIAWVVGLPSVIAIAFVGAVELWYAFQTATDFRVWLAASAGLIAVTLFAAGLPIAWALTRETNAFAARAALGLWAACVVMLIVTTLHFTQYRPEAAPAPIAAEEPEASPGFFSGVFGWLLPSLSREDSDELDIKIETVRGQLEDYAEDLRPEAAEWQRARASTPEAKAQRLKLAAQLRLLEIRRYGGPVTLEKSAPAPVAIAKPAGRPGFDVAALVLLMIGGASLGLLISAGSLAAILTEKAATVRLEPAPVPAAPAALPAIDLPASNAGESADGFEHWAISCLSKLPGSRTRPGEAHASYLQFCARNDYTAPLPLPEFGRRLRSWLTDTYGLEGHHSNGTVYNGVTLAASGPAITAPAASGAA